MTICEEGGEEGVIEGGPKDTGDCGFQRLRVPENVVLETRPKDGFPASCYNILEV